MRQDLQFAVRQMLRQPGLSVAAVLTLGLGIGASLAVFTLVNAVLLRPLPYSDPGELMAVSRGPAGTRQNVSHADVDLLREHVTTCGPIAAHVSGSGLNVMLDGVSRYATDRLVSHAYFSVLGVPLRWGRDFTPQEDVAPPAAVVILNERFVRDAGLDPSAIVGGEVELAGRPHTIVGIVAAEHMRPSDAAIFRPLGRDARGGGQNLQVVCRRQKGASATALHMELSGLLAEGQRRRLFNERATAAYSAQELHEWEYGGLRPQLTMLLLAVALVLLVAAANTTGLLLVRAAGRRREIAVRTALGAAPHRIARALVIEGLVLAAAAGLVGLLGAPLLVRGLLAVAPPFYGRLADFSLDAAVAGVALLLCLAVGAAVAVPPLLEAMRVNLRDTLQEEGRSGTHGRRTVWMRQLLIGAETAVCAVLLVGAVLLSRTFVNLIAVDTGIDSRGVLTARMSVQGPRYDDGEQLVRFFEEGIRRLEASPVVDAAAVGASLPAERALNLPARFIDHPQPDEQHVVNWRYVTPGYFGLLRMRRLSGRLLDDTDRAGAPLAAVVNETFARQVYGSVDEALGRRIVVRDHPPREVVGIVSDTSGWTLGDPPQPMLFVPLAQAEANLLAIAHQYFPPRWIIRSERDPEGARRHLHAVARELDPLQPFIEIESLDAMMLRSISVQRFYLVVLSAFSIFAMLLATVGIYATYAYALSMRRTEIGVRLALGASPVGLVRGVVGEALVLGGVATAVGLGVAAASARVLRAVLFDVTTTDPATYGAVAVVLLATTALATGIPAARAAHVDPLVTLRK